MTEALALTLGEVFLFTVAFRELQLHAPAITVGATVFKLRKGNGAGAVTLEDERKLCYWDLNRVWQKLCPK